MSQLREKYNGALNVLQTFPATLIMYAIEDIKKYVNSLEEIRRLDNQIITNMNNEEEIQANARLISVAPELLIELLKSIAELDKTGFASIQAETLIMKATGWKYQKLNEVLTRMSNGEKVEDVLDIVSTRRANAICEVASNGI